MHGLKERAVPVPAHVVRRRVGGGTLAQRRDARIVFGYSLVHQYDDRVLIRQPDAPPVGFLERRGLTGGEIVAAHVAALRLRPDEIVVHRILRGDEAVAATDGGPVVFADLTVRHAARTAPRVVVLQPAANAIRDVHVVAHMVKLAERNVVEVLPVSTLVVRDGDAAVVPYDHPLGIVGVDPKGVMIHMHADRRTAGGLTAIVGKPNRREVHAIRIVGIDTHLRVIERTAVEIVRLLPRVAAILGSVQARPARIVVFVLNILLVLSLDQGVHHVRAARADRYPDTTLRRSGESVALDLRPRVAAVGRLPEAASRPATLQEPRSAHPLPARGEEDVGIAGVHGDVHETRLVADELHEVPSVTPVPRAVHPTLGVGVPDVAQSSHVDDVRIAGMDHDAADDLGLDETLGLPGHPAVGRFEDATARRDRISGIFLAGAGPDLVVIAGRDGEVAHRDHALVGPDGLESGAVIGGLPDTTGRGGHVEGLGGAR